MTLDYYQQQADAFFAATVNVDMSSLYERFLPRVSKGGHIVDAGCGSGRDSKHFADLGYKVTAVDASPALVQKARDYTGLPVACHDFMALHCRPAVDAIWACASLLHVPESELAGVLAHLAAQLKTGGVLYCSFKYGRGEVVRHGRRFTDMDEAGLEQLVTTLPLALAVSWQTADLRPGREHETWLNALLVKEAN
ncbi:class I SAM-dependent methyltransferase [Oceanimonas sp. CHS3-5]|uniref:class I SAM-dependent methyltransferase n=1 Tax=Oceanimonas sp. CHS3-5 TaxID=3068186 RepID=UPI00273FDDE4|nr:class I SAM-dependent methyltransferase [Oceanimonas sp. CHS3-5]MDP5292559.1 class I SAM-dependent methyltransferase [Oceanimonas sp. CHS3-5]